MSEALDTLDGTVDTLNKTTKEVESLRQDVAMLEGLVEQHERTISSLEDKLDAERHGLESRRDIIREAAAAVHDGDRSTIRECLMTYAHRWLELDLWIPSR